MGFHKPLIRPAISWGGVRLGGIGRPAIAGFSSKFLAKAILS